MNKKILIPILIFIILISFGVSYIILSKTIEPEVETENYTQVRESKYSKVTTKVFDKILSKKSLSGLFLPGILCSSKDKCNSNQISYSDGMPMIWALNRKYLNTRDDRYFNEIVEISNVYSDKNIVSEIGYGDYPPCRFAYEILNNKKLKKQSPAITIICKNGNRADYLTAGIEAMKQNINNVKKSIDTKIDFILEQKNVAFVNTKYTDILKDVSIESYPYFASDYYYLSLFSNKTYLEKSYYLFDALLESFATKKTISSQFTCRLGQLSLDLYNVDKNEKYLNLAKSFMPSKNSKNFNIDCALLGDRLINDFNLDYKYFLNNYSEYILDQSTDYEVESILTSQKLNDRYDKTTRKNALILGVMENIYLEN